MTETREVAMTEKLVGTVVSVEAMVHVKCLSAPPHMEDHWLTHYEVAPQLRGRLNPGDLVTLVYTSGPSFGVWHLVSREFAA